MYEDLWEPGPHPRLPQLPRVIINMVSSLDGKASIRGKAGSIGGEADRRLMRILRSRADAVMIGSGTLRAEKISLRIPYDLAQTRASRGLSEQPLHIILSGGTIPELDNIIDPIPGNTILIVEETAGEIMESGQKVRDVVRTPLDSEGRIDLQKAIHDLRREYGVDLLIAEGGPSLNHSLFSSGLADELQLTLAPKIIAGDSEPPTTIVNGPNLPYQKQKLLSIHAAQEDPPGDLFLRYRMMMSYTA